MISRSCVRGCGGGRLRQEAGGGQGSYNKDQAETANAR